MVENGINALVVKTGQKQASCRDRMKRKFDGHRPVEEKKARMRRSLIESNSKLHIILALCREEGEKTNVDEGQPLPVTSHCVTASACLPFWRLAVANLGSFLPSQCRQQRRPWKEWSRWRFTVSDCVPRGPKARWCDTYPTGATPGLPPGRAPLFRPRQPPIRYSYGADVGGPPAGSRIHISSSPKGEANPPHLHHCTSEKAPEAGWQSQG
ncbi:hypothetical protein CPLU01_13921 [Colletotrichum plurivorum]|uniref:Uncharacterized protein n=1 Tax=Colletotrichum plurivorum TaxID=2175906 RepID=A0A8H6N0Y6_9PEZI|nr:hypothetical protein CPLU01_13921 [Colletotrichum plurivorum]